MKRGKDPHKQIGSMPYCRSFKRCEEIHCYGKVANKGEDVFKKAADNAVSQEQVRALPTNDGTPNCMFNTSLLVVEDQNNQQRTCVE
jgi:hypothetical protein